MYRGRPAVTVVMPVSGSTKMVQDSLHSLSLQTLAGLQVLLVVDNGLSVDQNHALCCKQAQQDARFRVVYGRTSAYHEMLNQGLNAAKSIQPEYIGFFAPGDIIADPRMYRRLYWLAKRRRADIVGGKHGCISPDLPQRSCQGEVEITRSRRDILRARAVPLADDSGFSAAGRVTLDPAQAKLQLIASNSSYRASLYRTTFLHSIGARFKYARPTTPQDLPFTIEALCQASVVVRLDQYLLTRQHGCVAQNRQEALRAVEGAQKAIRLLYAEGKLPDYGEALVSCVALANCADYCKTPPEWRRRYTAKLIDLFKWLKNEGVPIDANNCYLTGQQLRFVRHFSRADSW